MKGHRFMSEIESGKIKVGRTAPAETGDFTVNEVPRSVQVPTGRTFHVHDQRTRVAGYVHREVLRNALGETYAYDVIPLCVPNGNAIDVAYMLTISTPSPMIGTGEHVSVTSKPFEYMMSEETVQEIVRQMIQALRSAVARMLAHPER
jgi:hypothetical protein